MDAKLKYKLSERSLIFEIFEKLPRGQDLILSHTAKDGQDLNQVSVKWDW
jgi:hypothetical protein